MSVHAVDGSRAPYTPWSVKNQYILVIDVDLHTSRPSSNAETSIWNAVYQACTSIP